MQGLHVGCNAQNAPQNLANVLWKIVLSLTQRYRKMRALYPALKLMFDSQRAAYRRMKEEAEQAVPRTEKKERV
jgi:hypothetical protein